MSPVSVVQKTNGFLRFLLFFPQRFDRTFGWILAYYCRYNTFYNFFQYLKVFKKNEICTCNMRSIIKNVM